MDPPLLPCVATPISSFSFVFFQVSIVFFRGSISPLEICSLFFLHRERQWKFTMGIFWDHEGLSPGGRVGWAELGDSLFSLWVKDG